MKTPSRTRPGGGPAAAVTLAHPQTGYRPPASSARSPHTPAHQAAGPSRPTPHDKARTPGPDAPFRPVHSHAPRRPFRVGQDRRKGRRLLPDILTLASHTTAGKDEPTRPFGERPLPAHHDAVVLALGGGQQGGGRRRARTRRPRGCRPARARQSGGHSDLHPPHRPGGTS